MKKALYATLIIYLATFIFISCNSDNKEVKNGKSGENRVQSETEVKSEKIKRGKYLVESIGCGDCHSPKIMTDKGPQQDPQRLLSGHPANDTMPNINPGIVKDWVLFSHDLTTAVGPWGISYSANITSDPTGIGNWTEEQFFRAIREGKSKGLANARNLLPPMPWMYYANLSDEDLSSMFFYLQSTNPIENVPPAPKTLEEINPSINKKSKK